MESQIAYHNQFNKTMKKAMMIAEYKKIPKLSIRLEELFTKQGIDIVKFAGESPSHHEQEEEILNTSREICETFGFWEKNYSRHFISMSTSFHPTGSVSSCAIMAALMALVFYIDNLHRNKLDDHANAEQIDRFILICEDDLPAGELSNLEKGLRWILDELMNDCDIRCLTDIKAELIQHFRDGYKKKNIKISSIADYIEKRTNANEMWFVIVGAPHCLGAYLDWELYREIGIDTNLLKLQTYAVDFSIMTCDLFTFENNSIIAGSRENLICAIYDNRCITLREAIDAAVKSIANLIKEYQTESSILRDKIMADPELQSLQVYIDWIHNVMRACWAWQYANIMKYSSKESIFIGDNCHANLQKVASLKKLLGLKKASSLRDLLGFHKSDLKNKNHRIEQLESHSAKTNYGLAQKIKSSPNMLS